MTPRPGRGLEPQDAVIFFGRDAAIIRGMAEPGVAKVLVTRLRREPGVGHEMEPRMNAARRANKTRVAPPRQHR